MRGLVWNADVQAKVQAKVEWAERPENWYDPAKCRLPPGDNPAYVLYLATGFRVVYSHTVVPLGNAGGPARHCRHLSISVDGPNYPNPIATWSIATWYGFTDGRLVEHMTIEPGPDWLMAVNHQDHCVVIVQEIQETEENL